MVYLGIVSLIVAMGVTSMATPWVIRLARRLGAIDLPGGRKTHVEPMPRIGGVAVFLGFLAGLGTAAFLAGFLFDPPQAEVSWAGLVLAGSVIFLCGLVDDLWDVSFRWKFLVQIACAVYVWHCGFRIDVVTNPLTNQALELGPLSLPLTVLWIVGITNAVNLIDGLDGLAAGIALITTIAVALIAFKMNSLGVTAASVALAGSLIGFLRYNFNPARIFLGDSGSMFLGFVLAVTSVRSSQKLTTALAVFIPLLVLAIPLLDTSMAIARRLYHVTARGRNSDRMLRYVVTNLDQVFHADRGHLHHRLVDIGMSHRTAVLVLYAIGLLGAAGALVLTFVKDSTTGSLLLGVFVGTVAILLVVLYLRIRRLDDPRVGEAESLGAPALGETWSPPKRAQGR